MPVKIKNKSKIKNKRLLDNNKFLLLISFVLACIFWIAFASTSTEDSTIFITDIPVSIELPEQLKNSGLQVYRGGDIKVNVQIKGNRLSVGSVSQSDIQVVAQNISSITVPDTYALSLSAKKVGIKTDYEIVSVSPSVINITVDRERVQKFNIEKNIDTSKVTLPVNKNSSVTDYYLSKPILSVDTVTVTGPEQEVKKIAKVQVNDVIKGEYGENITKTLPVHLLDSDGEEIESDLMDVSPRVVDATIQVLPQKVINIIPEFNNIPSGIDINKLVSVKPSTIKVASLESELDKISEIKLAPIDFNTLDPTKTQITCDITLPAGFVNISNETQARVSLNLSEYKTKVFNISNFSIKSIPKGYTAEVLTSSIKVSVAGPSDYLDDIESSDIEAIVDLSTLTNGFEGSQEVPITVNLSSLNSCWCFNEYTVNVSLKKANS